MPYNRTRLAGAAILLIALMVAVFFGRRSTVRPPLVPTADNRRVQTQAVAAFVGHLTSTALAAPTGTASETPPPLTASATLSTEAAGTASLSPTPSCYRMQYVRDVTIPDNSIMTPAEVFTKTWQVQNNGLCAWRAGFKLVLIGGNAMGGSPFTLDASVNPGAKIEVSVKMVAPTDQTGIVEGTWRMTDDGDRQFGDALTVVIVIGNGSVVPPTVPSTSTP